MPTITRQTFKQALAITSDTDAEVVRQGLRDIMRDCMDWYHTFQHQTEGTIKQLKIAIMAKHPAYVGNTEALDAMLAYCRRYYGNAQWEFKGNRDRPKFRAMRILMKERRTAAETTRCDGATAFESDAGPCERPSDDGQPIDGPGDLEEPAILAPESVGSPESSERDTPFDANRDAENDALLDFMHTRTLPGDPSVSGLDHKTLALAAHIAQVFARYSAAQEMRT
ncbi:hypothetical protein HWV62_24568 [Athelia sp. TMB]|nr:hypothetical protein HWV62_24568 [Athelia sp. TMB]